MPLIHAIQTGAGAKLAIWYITEPEEFFRSRVDVERVVHHPHKRLQHLAARYLLTELEPDFPTAEIRVTKAGKPYLPGHRFHFSLAHSGEYAAAILSTSHLVGIDIELISPKIERVASRFLDLDELAFLSETQRTAHLTLCWCAKEAVVKWYGAGGVDFRENIHLDPFSPETAGRINGRFCKDRVSATLSLDYMQQRRYQVAWLVEDGV